MKMKTFLLLAAFFVLAVPTAFAAPPGSQGNQGGQSGQTGPSGQSPSATPSQNCREQRRTMGMADFRSTYAPTSSPKVAFDVCVARLSAQAASVAKNAAQACVAERALNPTTFMDNYGVHGNKANAFGKCVSMKARGLTEAAEDATLDAAAECKADRQKMGAQGFKDAYGTNANKSNAFGKCIKEKKKPTQS